VGSYRLEDDAGLIATVVGGDDSGVIGLPVPTVRRLLAAAVATSRSALP
jgi:predicted house-cleaning NTP pyrophosphatase (Maf/HAM1 superfamily)